MSKIKFIQTTPQELQNQISEGVKNQLNDFSKHFTQKQLNKYLTQSIVVMMLNVCLSTIHIGISGRTHFLRSEVEANIKPLNV